MSLEGQTRRDGLLLASGVVEGGVGGGDKLRTSGRVAIRELISSPDGEAGRVAIPVLVGDGGITKEVELIRRVIVVNIMLDAINGTGELISAVLNTPDPENRLAKKAEICVATSTHILLLSTARPTSLRSP